MTVAAETVRRSVASANMTDGALPAVSRWLAKQCLHAGRWSNVYLADVVGCVSQADGACNYVLKHANRQHHPQSSDWDFARSRIARETTVARQVENPHLIPILAGEVSDNLAWIVQPYCGPETLRHYVDYESSLPQLLWLVRQTCEALAALHAAGWLHGDICPENIVVSAEGHVTLIDLGFARRLGTAECDVYQTPFTGRPIYAAPEAFTSAGELTSAADMYSLGVLLYELLVGDAPFAHYQAEEALAAKKMLAPADVRQFNPELPFSLSNLLARLLSRQPLRRPSAKHVIETLVALEVEAFLMWR